MRRWGTRLSAALVGGTVGVLALAGTAFAHVEVSADNPQAGATNVVVTFDAAAESDSAGITKIEVVLPEGITTDQVTLDDAPSGWTLKTTSKGYTVGGKALGVGTNAEHSVTIARLPNEESLVFRTLVTYANGDVDRWIEPPTASNPDPANPAPVLELEPAAPAPTTAAPTTAAPTIVGGTTNDVITAAPTPPAAAPGDDDGPSWWWLLGLALVAAVVVAVVMMRRRGAGPPAPGAGSSAP
jgi:uncharacterized protein YcnI